MQQLKLRWLTLAICQSSSEPGCIQPQSLADSRLRGVQAESSLERAFSDPPSSPRLRQSTFGATLDFIEALCDASAGLTSFATVAPSLTCVRLAGLPADTLVGASWAVHARVGCGQHLCRAGSLGAGTQSGR